MYRAFHLVYKVYKVCRRMSDSIWLPRGRRDDYIIMLSKYDSLEFKGNNSFVSSQTLNLLPHFGSMNKTFSKRRLYSDGDVAKIGDKSSLPIRFSHKNEFLKGLRVKLVYHHSVFVWCLLIQVLETVFRIMERNICILFWIQTSHSDSD